MVRAFIAANTAAGTSEDLRQTVDDLDGVLESHVVAGNYDLIVEAEGDEVYSVMHDVATRVRGLSGVADTKTYICLE